MLARPWRTVHRVWLVMVYDEVATGGGAMAPHKPPMRYSANNSILRLGFGCHSCSLIQGHVVQMSTRVATVRMHVLSLAVCQAHSWTHWRQALLPASFRSRFDHTTCLHSPGSAERPFWVPWRSFVVIDHEARSSIRKAVEVEVQSPTLSSGTRPDGSWAAELMVALEGRLSRLARALLRHRGTGTGRLCAMDAHGASLTLPTLSLRRPPSTWCCCCLPPRPLCSSIASHIHQGMQAKRRFRLTCSSPGAQQMSLYSLIAEQARQAPPLAYIILD